MKSYASDEADSYQLFRKRWAVMWKIDAYQPKQPRNVRVLAIGDESVDEDS